MTAPTLVDTFIGTYYDIREGDWFVAPADSAQQGLMVQAVENATDRNWEGRLLLSTDSGQVSFQFPHTNLAIHRRTP